jgi:ketosteroid isomerase-like protein
MKTGHILAAVSLIAACAVPATAQSDSTSGSSASEAPRERQQERLGAILGALFGRRGASGSLEAQWALGRTPLATQRSQFDTRVDAEVRAGALPASTGYRLKSDYQALVDLEARYAGDGRFTTAERRDLADRYGALTQALADRRYGDDDDGSTAFVIGGQAEFNARVDAQVAARRLSRGQGTRLRNDYAALIRVENNYLRDGTLTAREREDLEARLDSLDMRVGDVSYGGTPAQLTFRQRLDAVVTALPRSGLTAAARAQLLVEHGDLVRLDAAYQRLNPGTDDRAYLEARIANLEARARVMR